MTAHLTYCLIRLGYRESSTVAAALNYIITSQRNDGGWHCDRLKQCGERDESLPSCSAANIHVIRMLGQYGAKYETIATPAIKQCLSTFNHPFSQSCFHNSEDQINFNKLRYPPHYTGLDILNVIDSLSLFGNIVKCFEFESIIASILNRWDGVNFLCSEKRIPNLTLFDFSHNHKSSDWITAIFLRALERVYFKNQKITP